MRQKNTGKVGQLLKIGIIQFLKNEARYVGSPFPFIFSTNHVCRVEGLEIVRDRIAAYNRSLLLAVSRH